MTNHQRVGAISNAHAGREFERIAAAYYVGTEKWKLTTSFRVEVGAGRSKKVHRFDLGCEDPAVLIECKSHTFTESGAMPSAKLTVWNEAMYLFYLAPVHFRKILFVLEATHERRNKDTLAACYARNHGHLIPPDVELVEYNVDTDVLRRIA